MTSFIFLLIWMVIVYNRNFLTIIFAYTLTQIALGYMYLFYSILPINLLFEIIYSLFTYIYIIRGIFIYFSDNFLSFKEFSFFFNFLNIIS